MNMTLKKGLVVLAVFSGLAILNLACSNSSGGTNNDTKVNNNQPALEEFSFEDTESLLGKYSSVDGSIEILGQKATDEYFLPNGMDDFPPETYYNVRLDLNAEVKQSVVENGIEKETKSTSCSIAVRADFKAGYVQGKKQGRFYNFRSRLVGWPIDFSNEGFKETCEAVLENTINQAQLEIPFDIEENAIRLTFAQSQKKVLSAVNNRYEEYTIVLESGVAEQTFKK